MIDSEVISNQNKDDPSSCSESTTEVFFEMLGLSSMEYGDISSAVEDEADGEEKKHELDLPQPLSIDCNYKSLSPSRQVDEDYQQSVVSLLNVPTRCSRYLHKPSAVAAFLIENLITNSMCQSLIRLAEELSSTGFHYVKQASHTDNEGDNEDCLFVLDIFSLMFFFSDNLSAILTGNNHKVLLQNPNKHKLSVFEHETTLTTLWNILEPAILPHLEQFMTDTKCGRPLGLNPRLRILRYDALDNDVFDPHFDATTRVTPTGSCIEMTSLLTVLIYLNDGGGKDFDGGETHYLDSTNTNTEPTIVIPTMGSVVVFEHDLYHSSVPLNFGTKYVLRTDVLFKLTDGAGVDKPRRINSDETQQSTNAQTLLELCGELGICEDAKASLSEIGLIDLTLESLVAPGMTALKHMLSDVLEEDVTTVIMSALESCGLQN